MREYLEFIKEHKFWGKSIPEFLDWLENISNRYFIIFDSETTGLPSSGYEVQLTQVSCVVAKYNYTSNTFDEVDTFNKKVKLTPKTLSMKSTTRIPKVLSFNHYGEKGVKYHDEEETLSDFYNFIDKYENPVLVIQNAAFDMRYLNIRNKDINFKNEVLDTKQVIQLFYLPCLMKLAETDITARDTVEKIGTSERDNGLISSSLSKIGPALGINMSGYHDALVDCRLASEMFIKIVEFLKENKGVDIKQYQGQRIKIIR